MGIARASAGAVVVAVDGSDASLAALHWGADQALLTRRPLALLHAAMTSGATSRDVAAETTAAAAQAHGRAVVARARDLVEERHQLPELRSEVIVGDPRRVLLDASEHAFLLVLGSRGRGPVKSLLLGSVGVTLAHRAACPVVVRRPHGSDGGRLGIVVGTDGVRHSEPAVEWAYGQAALRGMRLTLVRAFVDGPSAGTLPADEPGHEVLWSQLDAVAQQFARRHPSVEVSLLLERGLPGEALARAAAGMDTVVVGTHVRRAVLRVLDVDVTTRLVETAPCCVAVVPPPA
jgi:nucleotide-binding universal stress UspA family protein